jgi:hypothetical protein
MTNVAGLRARVSELVRLRRPAARAGERAGGHADDPGVSRTPQPAHGTVHTNLAGSFRILDGIRKTSVFTMTISAPTTSGAPMHTRRVAIYARTSTDKQQTANQLRELRQWAKRAGHEVGAGVPQRDSCERSTCFCISKLSTRPPARPYFRCAAFLPSSKGRSSAACERWHRQYTSTR